MAALCPSSHAIGAASMYTANIFDTQARCLETNIREAFVLTLKNVVFDEPGFSRIELAAEMPVAELFDILATLFTFGCQQQAPRVTFDDILEVKARMRQLQVDCRLHQSAFPDHGIPDQPLTLFCKAVGADMAASQLKIVGDGSYDVTFVPTYFFDPSARLGCTWGGRAPL